MEEYFRKKILLMSHMLFTLSSLGLFVAVFMSEDGVIGKGEAEKVCRCRLKTKGYNLFVNVKTFGAFDALVKLFYM